MKAIKVMRIPFLNLVFTLYSLLWVYSTVGIELYGGKITSQLYKDIKTANPETEIANEYVWLNFNDFASGLITLVTMMLFNNWQFIWEAFYLTDRSLVNTDFFFLTFMVMATYVIINILMAFVIDVYTSIEDSSKVELEEKNLLIKLTKNVTQ